jgi:hypothetical protein
MWENRAAGVASWLPDVVMSPVAKPWSLASSRIVFCDAPLVSMPRAPLYVLVPVVHPVALAAESVT